MSGGLTSLESAIRTCKVNTGNAERIESDRFLGSADNKTCPQFMGTDLTGRGVCSDSFMTKSSGCNTASDRVWVENTVSRPHYYEYINLSPRGLLDDATIEGFGYGQQQAAYIREGFNQPPPVTLGSRALTNNGYGYNVPVYESVDDLPPDLRFNSSQPGPFNNMPLWSFNVVPQAFGMPYNQLYGQAAEQQRVKQALLMREAMLGENPIIPGREPGPYRTLRNY